MVLRLVARGGRRRCRSTECRDGALARRDGEGSLAYVSQVVSRLFCRAASAVRWRVALTR